MTLTALKPQAPAQVIWQDATPECEVGHIIRKPYAPIALVVGKEILKDGRTCLIVTFPNCRDRHTEEWVVGEVAAPVVEESIEVAKVEVEAPATSAPVHTAETLKTLTWNQVQKLHTSLGLKATAKTRTRRDYEARILAAQPQQVADTKVVATTQPELHQVTAQPAPKTFNHPFRYRRDIYNGQHSFSSAMYGLCECDRCKVLQTNSQEIQQLPALIVHLEELTTATPEATTITADTDGATTDDAPPNRGDNGRGRVTALTLLPEATIALPHATKPKADDNFMTAFTKESEGDRKFNDLAYLSQLEMEAQLAIERTVIGSEDEAIAYRHLRSIEEDIKYYGQSKSEPQPCPTVIQLEKQMTQLKKDVQEFTLDASILSLAANESKELDSANETEPEGTIYWQDSRLRTGLIVGKKGVRRYFYVKNDEIYVVINSGFTASERKHPNIHHTRIRQAIETGKQFNPIAFKQSPEFASYTENYRDMGWIYQGPDGRWWAWKNGGVTGHPFFNEQTACDYLEATMNNQFVYPVAAYAK